MILGCNNRFASHLYFNSHGYFGLGTVGRGNCGLDFGGQPWADLARCSTHYSQVKMHFIWFGFETQFGLNFSWSLKVSLLITGCSNSICAKKTPLLAIKNGLLSHKNDICTFMRCGHLTYDPWIWFKITSMASTASNRKSVKNQQNMGLFGKLSHIERPW